MAESIGLKGGQISIIALCTLHTIFLFKRLHVQTKRKYLVCKEMQSLRIFPVYKFFCGKKITRACCRMFCLQSKE